MELGWERTLAIGVLALVVVGLVAALLRAPPAPVAPPVDVAGHGLGPEVPSGTPSAPGSPRLPPTASVPEGTPVPAEPWDPAPPKAD